MDKTQKEKMLEILLKGLDKNVFVKSTNNVTGEEEHLEPVIEDMEATIAISGEWDREDLKNILAEISDLAIKETEERMVREIEEYEKTADEHVEPNEVYICCQDILALIRNK
jgi:hypothetical protein